MEKLESISKARSVNLLFRLQICREAIRQIELFSRRLVALGIASACFSLPWLITSPAAAQSIQPIYTFTNALTRPSATLALGPDGSFCGTTWGGGTDFLGTVFQITTNGTQATLASFAYTNGAHLFSKLTLGPDGSFYGTTFVGGGSSNGTVFQITTNGTLTTLYSFSPFNNTNADGADPVVGLALGPDGNLYGATEYGGSGGLGTVFQFNTNGTLATLASFAFTNGSRGVTDLTLGPDGSFYGGTGFGGSSSNGTLYRITTNGALTTLASFAYTNGASPSGGLAFGPDGNLYGTTLEGGSNGNGTVFRITTNGALTVLVNFNNTNGASPRAMLSLGPDGCFYGTTQAGGTYDDGTVFRVTTNGDLTTLAAFDSTNNGAEPVAGLTLGPDGNFYGVTYLGGSTGGGVVYRLNLPPSVVTQPSNQIVAIGGNATFSVTLFGTAPFAYQWLSNTAPITDATNCTLTIPGVTPASAAGYQVIVTNAWGGITSSAASLTVLPQPNCYAISNNGPGSVTLFFAGTPGGTNRVWTTTNLNVPLAQWQPLFTNAADSTGLFQFTDTNVGNSPARFYILSSP